MPFITSFLYSQLFITPPLPTTSLREKTVIVTGSNTGLGFEASLQIARLGAEKLILAVRNISKGEEARKHILERASRETDFIEVWDLDMSHSASVKAFANRAQSLKRLDILIANAGISPTDFELSPDGNEMGVQVHVISNFLLCFLLIPQLRQTALAYDVDTHLEVVTSELYQIASKPEEVDIYESLNVPRNFGSASRYSMAMLIQVLVCRELATKIRAPVVTLVNPGLCHSEIGRNLKGAIRYIRAALSSVLARTTEVGGRCLVTGVSSGKNSHGQFMSNGVNQEVLAWIESSEGKRIQKSVWDQTMRLLEQIEPGLRKRAGL